MMLTGRSAIVSTRGMYIREAFSHFPRACAVHGFWRALRNLGRELAGAFS
jgi:hypothetical protein